MSNYNNHDTNALFDLLTTVANDTAKGIKQAADILVELKKRGESHPFTKGSVLKHYEAISSGKLTPLAAMTFGGVDVIVKRMILLPAKLQNDIACGEALPVAEVDAMGNVIKTEKVITRMSMRDLDLVFSKDKVRDIHTQERILRSKSAPVAPLAPRERVGVDEKTGKLIFGNMKVGPEELRSALRQLGFRIVRIKAEETTETA